MIGMVRSDSFADDARGTVDKLFGVGMGLYIVGGGLEDFNINKKKWFTVIIIERGIISFSVGDVIRISIDFVEGSCGGRSVAMTAV